VNGLLLTSHRVAVRTEPRRVGVDGSDCRDGVFMSDGVPSHDRRPRPVDGRRHARSNSHRADAANDQGTAAAAAAVVPVPGDRAVRQLLADRLDRQHPAALLRQLGARLRVRVEEREVGHDDRDRKCYGDGSD